VSVIILRKINESKGNKIIQKDQVKSHIKLEKYFKANSPRNSRIKKYVSYHILPIKETLTLNKFTKSFKHKKKSRKKSTFHLTSSINENINHKTKISIRSII
jgi:hypothetical protein